MSSLSERKRPRHLDDVIGQDKAVAKLRTLQANGGFGGRAFLITGPSASGKTTLANIIATSVASEFAIEEMDSAGLTPKSLQDWERKTSGRPFGMGGWALIVNECHGLRKDTIRQLLVTLERLPKYVTVVLTTTNHGKQLMFDECIDAGPLTSRCIVLALDCSIHSREVAAAITFRKAHAEIGDARPIEAYINLFREECGNWRACWNRIETGDL